MIKRKFHSLSEQVAEVLKEGILSGRWRWTLPGRNRLAGELGVSHKGAIFEGIRFKGVDLFDTAVIQAGVGGAESHRAMRRAVVTRVKTSSASRSCRIRDQLLEGVELPLNYWDGLSLKVTASQEK